MGSRWQEAVGANNPCFHHSVLWLCRRAGQGEHRAVCSGPVVVVVVDVKVAAQRSVTLPNGIAHSHGTHAVLAQLWWCCGGLMGEVPQSVCIAVVWTGGEPTHDVTVTTPDPLTSWSLVIARTPVLLYPMSTYLRPNCLSFWARTATCSYAT